MQKVATRHETSTVLEDSRVEEASADPMVEVLAPAERASNLIPMNEPEPVLRLERKNRFPESPPNHYGTTTIAALPTVENKQTGHSPEPLFVKLQHDVPATTVIQTTTNFVDAAGEIKKESVELEGFEIIGEEWLTLRWAKGVCLVNNAFWRRLQERIPSLIYQTWALCGLLGSEGFYTWYLVVYALTGSAAGFVIICFLLLLCLAYIICTAVEIYYFACCLPHNHTFLTVYVWVQCIYCGLSVYVFLSFLLAGYDLGWGFMVGVLTTTSLQLLNLSLWIVLGSILVLMLVVECMVRIAKCKLACPISQRKRRVFEYRLYTTINKATVGATQCAICLGNYAPDSTDLCVLLCRTNHVFHEKCILEWAKKQECCPVCRGPILFSTT